MAQALAFFILAGLPVFPWAAVQTPIYSLLADDAGNADDVFIWGPAADRSVVLSTVTSPTPPEGVHSLQATWVVPNGTWAAVYLDANKANRAVDLSPYAASGEIRFWANCTTDQFSVFLQHLDGAQELFNFAGAFDNAFNQWVSVAIPLNTIGFPINDIFSPFGMTMNTGHTGTCYIDNVRYVNPPAPNAAIFSATVKNISDQSTATQFSWSGVTLPTGWARADQYIDLELDDPSDLTWGVQIYTDNTHSSNPSTTFVSGVPVGQVGSNPAGLVDTQNTTQVLSLAWSVKAGTNTPVNAEPTPAEPNNNGVGKNPTDKNAFQWLYMEDLASPAIVTNGTEAFVNGNTAVVVKNNLGIHFGQSDTEIGAAHAPNYIYLEANFGTASTPRTYQTDTLTIEFFHE